MVDLSNYNNDWYQPGSAFKRTSWYYINILFIKNSLLPFSGLKVFLLRLYGAKIGKGVMIKPSVNIKYPWFLTIGDHCWIGEKAWIDNLGPVTIGAHSCLSQGALLLSGNHDFSKEGFDLMIEPIVLEEGVWIGAQAVVCGGATCKSHAVLTAGSVASGELNAFSIYRGNPAEFVKLRVMK